MRGIVSTIAILMAFGNAAASASSKIAFWDSNANSQAVNKITHITKSINTDHVLEIPASFGTMYEAVVFLSNEVSLSQKNVIDDIKKSSNAEILNNLYGSNSIKNAVMNNAHMSKAKHISVAELDALIKDGSILSNGQVDSFVIAAHDDTSLLDGLFATTNALPAGKLLFIATEGGTTATTTTAAATAPTEAGQYQRHLSASTATTTPKKVLATSTTPATGAEFSIYYEGTYLYITPDIFTGLMTGIFMFFVVLIGVSCLGDIQGMSSFYDKVPSNGKEA